ncbi:hypothetical protein Lser_V15G45158 [Lactuca serriola]
MDFRNNLVMVAGSVVFNMVMCLVRFPGGLATLGNRDGDWVFFYADLIALCISMNVLVVGMSVGPTLWKKIEELARNAMLIALSAMAIAVHQIILRVLGGDYWSRLFVNGSFIALAVVTCGFNIFLRCGYWTK